jgi:CRP/FNR family transcriptional regulator, cyclic AMP receptor protein
VTTELHKLLARTWIFSDLSPAEIDALTSLAKMKVARPKQHVVKKGDAGGQIFVVLRGRLKVVTPGSGQDAAFRIMGPGELFGEISAFDGEGRSATVTALEPCQLAVIEPSDFSLFLERHPSVSRKLLGVLARRVRQLSERVEDRAFLDVPARLAKCLVGLSDAYGKDGPDGRIVELHLSQQEIGELVDATRESVNKFLRQWKRDGLVTHAADTIVVHRPEELRALGRIRA